MANIFHSFQVPAHYTCPSCYFPICIWWQLQCWFYSMLILCNGVNVGFWRRSSARTINSQLATIWKILGDLCHILWRLFTIARPTYFRCQFVVDYWQHITFIGRIRRESTDKYKYKIQNTYAKTNAQHLPKYLRCHFVVIGNTSLLLTECRGNKEPTTKQVMQKQILTCQSILTGDMSLTRWYWHGADKVTSQEHGIWHLAYGICSNQTPFFMTWKWR